MLDGNSHISRRIIATSWFLFDIIFFVPQNILHDTILTILNKNNFLNKLFPMEGKTFF